jgi:hypothetical protein
MRGDQHLQLLESETRLARDRRRPNQPSRPRMKSDCSALLRTGPLATGNNRSWYAPRVRKLSDSRKSTYLKGVVGWRESSSSSSPVLELTLLVRFWSGFIPIFSRCHTMRTSASATALSSGSAGNLYLWVSSEPNSLVRSARIRLAKRPGHSTHAEPAIARAL